MRLATAAGDQSASSAVILPDLRRPQSCSWEGSRDGAAVRASPLRCGPRGGPWSRAAPTILLRPGPAGGSVSRWGSGRAFVGNRRTTDDNFHQPLILSRKHRPQVKHQPIVFHSADDRQWSGPQPFVERT